MTKRMPNRASHLIMSVLVVTTQGVSVPDVTRTVRPQTLQPVSASIRNVASNLTMQIGRASVDGPPILWYPSSGDSFTFIPVGEPEGWNGSFQIKVARSGKCLHLNGAHSNGDRVIQRDCFAHPLQYWRREPLTAGHCSAASLFCQGPIRIRSVYGGKCVDSGNPHFPNPPRIGAPIQQWQCIRSSSDRWAVNQTWNIGKRIGRRFPTTEIQQMVDQVIQVRRDLGKCADPSVRLDRALSDMARAHSADLATNYARLIDPFPQGDGRRGHIGSDGTMPADRMSSGGFTPAQRPENWYYGTNATLAQAMDSWLYHDEASHWGHRDAILNCEYRVIGVGSASGHDNRVYWTQNFALR
ncbi:RICIN domain-containing protein [Nonomuraea dietziae]|uniref:RICIN domain-containing protein n=1 Tax=Nonomuraea dietziae TaxID=65515 RepID=UPI0034175D8F